MLDDFLSLLEVLDSMDKDETLLAADMIDALGGVMSRSKELLRELRVKEKVSNLRV